jgi:hypothetical protein
MSERTDAAIIDLPSPEGMLASGKAELIVATMGETRVGGLRIKQGHLIVRNNFILPVVDGATCTDLFGELRADKYAPILTQPIQQTGELKDALCIQGAQNYYHFLAYNVPALALLGGVAGRDSVHLAHLLGFPKNAESFLARVLPVFSENRAVEWVGLSDGDYAVENVTCRAVPRLPVVVATARWLLAMLLKLLGPAQVARLTGPRKLFVRRDWARNGRNLVNQDEVQTWLMARGYTPFDPGRVPMEEQMLAFSRATHIVGVEGAALANILFATQAVSAIVLQSPNASRDTFFADIASEMDLPYKAITGWRATASPGDRSADFVLPIHLLEAHLP